MASLPNRKFEVSEAKREHVPLLVGLTGPSGGGKTFSALRLATGIQTVTGGDIFFIDTESRRALHYADRFKFKHVPFDAPFGSLDYLAALQFCVQSGAGVVIVDSMSHEHEGPGGMVDLHDQIAQRMSGGDPGKLERVKMLAWSEPKQKRRALINGILQLNANFIFCFRAKNTSKPISSRGCATARSRSMKRSGAILRSGLPARRPPPMTNRRTGRVAFRRLMPVPTTNPTPRPTTRANPTSRQPEESIQAAPPPTA
jgi:ABC-type oligopeptide transport system ATPase subunit